MMSLITKIAGHFIKGNDVVAQVEDTTQLPAEAISFFHSLRCMHDLQHFAKRNGAWKTIPRVKCPTPFGGYGYVEGRTEGMIINDRLTLVQGDDDMDLSVLVLLIDDLPCLLIRSKRGHLTVTVITDRDYFEEVLSHTGQPCNDMNEYLSLPPSMQNVMYPVFMKCLSFKPDDNAAIEKIITY